MAAGMFTELGGLNKWVHIWPYKTLGDRDRIRAGLSKQESGHQAANIGT
ncbi:MAG: hypothetical protein Ct9H300mP27_11460 [Chloroflexota bacterium]|nr:MAG: hypothetical protein Ct9H300mP27_11460 [Chloroflexota bacterium]